MNPPRLLAISPDAPLGGLQGWLAALAGAAPCWGLLRAPSLSAADAATLHARAARLGVPLIHHAKTAGQAAHRHLPAGMITADSRRDTPGLLGVSCHDAAALDRAFALGADYATLSPVWPPGSKPDDTRAPLGLPAFLALAAGRPVLALGGVDLARAQAAYKAGAYGVAALGLFAGPAAAANAKLLVSQWQPAE